MHPDLEKLLELQSKDENLLEVDLRLSDLLAEVAALDSALARGRAEVDEARQGHHAGAKRRDELEAKVDGLRVLQERRRQRLDLAKTTRELQALTSELELARSIMTKEEAEWFRAMEAANELENKVSAAEARLAELEAGQGASREDLAAKVAAVETERLAVAAERDAAARALSRPLLMRYDRLRSARQASPVVVPLHGNACGACFTAVPMSRRSHIRAGLLLDGCEACGVILYAAEALRT
jgi:predicted  nucleic acid-binding Zn-ribbon protein